MYKLLSIILLFILSFVIFSNRESFYDNDYDNDINVVISCDKNQFPGLLALINSIVKNSKKHKQLKFYILVNKNEKKILEKQINDKLNVNYMIKEISEDKEILDNIRVLDTNSKCDNIMNFSRFKFSDEFPNLKKIIYIDADIIVKDDISELYNSCDVNKHNFYAVKTGTKGSTHDFFDETFDEFNLDKNSPYFNAGLYITNLEFWRNNNLRSKLLDIMKKHKESEKGLFFYGTQPILNIIFKNFGIIENCWNTTGLGGDNKLSQDYLNKAKALHWNGPHKPWKEDGFYKELWVPFKV